MATYLIDSHHRRITYLRISLTDACNFRCTYCVPEEGVPLSPPSQYLHADEIERLVRIMAGFGVNRLRLTGGEPLLRKDLVAIVAQLKAIPGIDEVSLTTNGSLLRPKLRALKDAGLDRINISLDSVDAARFAEITKVDLYGEVWAAAQEALALRFPLKLNMVVLQGLSDAEIIRYVKLALDYPLEVRFLEFMPLCGTGWDKSRVLPIAHVRDVVKSHFSLRERKRGDDVAQSFDLLEGQGKIGFIASLTESFCDNCSRMRLTSTGELRPCLFSSKEVPIRELLRSGASDSELQAAIQQAAAIKPRGNWFRDHPFAATTPHAHPAYTLNPHIRTLGG